MDAPWLKYVPGFLRARLAGRFETQNIILNSSWLLLDKLLRMVVGLAVGVWMTRYLGAGAYGQLSYALAVVAIFSAIASAGMDAIVVRELVCYPTLSNAILASAFYLKLITGATALALTLVTSALTSDSQTFYLVAIIAIGLVFQAFDVVDFWFQSLVQSRFVVIARMVAFLLGSLIRILLILDNGTLTAFALVSTVEIAIGALCMVVVYAMRGYSLGTFSATSQMMRRLMRESWPLLLSSVAVMLYMRVDVVMLQEMVGTEAVGIYAAATRLSEVWYALPMVVVASASPSILRAHGSDPTAFLAGLWRLYFLLTWLAIGISLPLSVCSNAIVAALYGSEFSAAGPVLAIHLWASIAVFLGVASSQYLLARNLQRISFYRTAIGLACNIALNLVLIPRYQAAGAATATVISYFVATFSLGFFASTRAHSRVLLRAPFARHHPDKYDY